MPIRSRTVPILLSCAAAVLLAGCGDFWQAPSGSSGTTASTTTLTASTSTPVTDGYSFAFRGHRNDHVL
jgi:ABC-type phosphate transport system substrate-binding protein